jgi:hypothetical protein
MAMTPLGALIEEARRRFQDQHGVELSYADIARRGGGVITRGRVQQLAKDPIKAVPPAATLRALALGIGEREEVVIEKALASTGYGDVVVAARLGVPRQVQIDATERDLNVDPPAGDEPA